MSENDKKKWGKVVILPLVILPTIYYIKKGNSFTLGGLIFFLIPFLAISYFILSFILGRWGRLNFINFGENEKRELLDSDEYYREEVYGWKLDEMFVGLQRAGNMSGIRLSYSNLIAAYITKWYAEGLVDVVQNGIKILKDNPSKDPTDVYLWNMLESSAGDNKILEAKELLSSIRRKIDFVDKDGVIQPDMPKANFFEFLKYEGLRKLKADGFVDERGKITADGQKELTKAIEQDNFFKDFTLLRERKVEEAPLYEEYLYVSTLFGRSREVSKAFKDVNIPSLKFDTLAGMSDAGDIMKDTVLQPWVFKLIAIIVLLPFISTLFITCSIASLMAIF